jgi:hypothetical protein
MEGTTRQCDQPPAVEGQKELLCPVFTMKVVSKPVEPVKKADSGTVKKEEPKKTDTLKK